VSSRPDASGNGSYCYQAVIPDPLFLAFVTLPGLHDADQPAADDAARNDRRIHQHEDIERIAILAEGRGDETKIIRKIHAFGQRRRQFQAIAVRLVFILVAAALGRLDDILRSPVSRSKGLISDNTAWREWRLGMALLIVLICKLLLLNADNPEIGPNRRNRAMVPADGSARARRTLSRANIHSRRKQKSC
jgi:hypothetical protein